MDVKLNYRIVKYKIINQFKLSIFPICLKSDFDSKKKLVLILSENLKLYYYFLNKFKTDSENVINQRIMSYVNYLSHKPYLIRLKPLVFRIKGLL